MYRLKTALDAAKRVQVVDIWAIVRAGARQTYRAVRHTYARPVRTARSILALALASPGDTARSSRRIASIFAAHERAYRSAYWPSSSQSRVIRAITACRTVALGGHLQVCRDCDERVPLYNSCKNRHCPTCLGSLQARWLAEREQTILPVPYFHVVFTLPATLRELVRQNDACCSAS